MLSFNRRDVLKATGYAVFTGATVSKTVHADSTSINPGENVTGTIHSSDDRDTFELSVDQGDVVEIDFEKQPRDLVRLFASTPRGTNTFLGGGGSEGEETYRKRLTIEETGVLDLSVSTIDSELEDGQPYEFSVDRFDGLDRWPANDPAAIEPAEEITGTIHSSDDRDTFELSVDQGDVVEIDFEKQPRDLVRLFASTPRGTNTFLGGGGSEGEETYRKRLTIEETGVLSLDVSTIDSDEPTDPDEVVEQQPYEFSVDRFDGLDRWPANDPAAIEPAEEITGTIHSSDDRDTFDLLVDQGDVVEIDFEKQPRDLVRLFASTPRGTNTFLGGGGSEGEETYRKRLTIEETGVLSLDVSTIDSDEPTDPDEVVEQQPYEFSVDRFDGLDRWPANDPAAIEPAEEITGTIHSSDDRDTFELLVDRGDIVEIDFEKQPRDLVRLFASTPRGTNTFLGGGGSEGERRLTDSVSIEETGVLDLSVSTIDSDDPTDPDEVVDRQEYRFIIDGELDDDEADASVAIDSVEIGDDLPEESGPTDVIIEETAGVIAEDITITMTVESPIGELVYEAAISLDELADQVTVTFGVDDDTPELGPFERGGEYEITVDVTAANADATSTTESFTVHTDSEDEPPEEAYREWPVDEDLASAVDQDATGEIALGDLREAVDGWQNDGQVSGIEISLNDLRELVEFWQA